MRLDIQGRGFPLTPALLEHVRRRLRFEVGWASDRVQKVTVRLTDLNGPRGGSDKCCRIRIAVPHAAVVVEDVEGDLYVAISRAAGRAGRALSRRIARNRGVRAAKASRGLHVNPADPLPVAGH